MILFEKLYIIIIKYLWLEQTKLPVHQSIHTVHLYNGIIIAYKLYCMTNNGSAGHAAQTTRVTERFLGIINLWMAYL